MCSCASMVSLLRTVSRMLEYVQHLDRRRILRVDEFRLGDGDLLVVGTVLTQRPSMSNASSPLAPYHTQSYKVYYNEAIPREH